MKRYSDQIERLHLVDLDLIPLDGGTVEEACDELTTGLLVQHSVLIAKANSGDVYDVIRFTGPRTQLEELLNRYHGVVGSFDPSPFNPDPDPVMPI